MTTRQITRRRLLVTGLGSSFGVLAAACAAATPTPAPAKPTEAPKPAAAPTTAPAAAPTTAPAPAASTNTTAPVAVVTKPAAAEPTKPVAAAAPATGSASAEIEIWEQEVSIKAAEGAYKAFEAKYPNIKLKWVPTPQQDTFTKLLATISAGSGAPDLSFIAYQHVAAFTTRDGNGVVDLRPRIMSEGHKLDEWPKYFMDLVTTKSGKILGLPVDIGVGGMFYRRDVFEEAKLPTDPDKVAAMTKTWDGWTDTGQQIAGTGKFLIENAAAVFNVVRQQGKQSFFDESGKPIVNSPGFVGAAEMALKVRQKKLDLNPASGAESGAAMKQGKVGTYFSAAWFDIIINATAPETRGKWGATPLPQGTSAHYGSSYYVLSQQSKQQDAAWTFMNFLVATKEGLVPYLSGIKMLPGWKPIYSESFFTSPDPNYGGQVWLKQFVDNAENVPPITITPNDLVANDILTGAVAEILNKNLNPKERLDAANMEIERRIRQ